MIIKFFLLNADSEKYFYKYILYPSMDNEGINSMFTLIKGILDQSPCKRDEVYKEIFEQAENFKKNSSKKT